MLFGTTDSPVESYPISDPAAAADLTVRTVEHDHEDRIVAIHSLIATSQVAGEQNAHRAIHSVHCRFTLESDSRHQFYTNQGAVESLRVQLLGVKGEPFGPATPQAKLEMLLVNPGAQEFFSESDLGDEYEVVIFRHPKKA